MKGLCSLQKAGKQLLFRGAFEDLKELLSIAKSLGSGLNIENTIPLQ